MGASPQTEIFLFYTGIYLLHSLASTVLTVPYVALLPELSLDYQERTSLSTYRAAASTLGIVLAAMAFRPLAEALGGGAPGYAGAGAVTSVWLALPWLIVYRATRERPGFQRPPETTFAHGMRVLLANRSYRRLVGFYVCSRITMDLVGAMFLFWFTYWIARPGDFELTLGVLLLAGAASLPFWLRLSAHLDKRTVFLIGTSGWLVAQCILFAAGPEWSRWTILSVGVLAGVGFAVTDVLPWSMLGDVIDEDELTTGERREGIFSGSFAFLRKLTGASAVSLAGVSLELAGFVPGQAQSEGVVFTIRALIGLVPAAFLLLALWIAFGYRLDRATHTRIRAALDARRAAPSPT